MVKIALCDGQSGTKAQDMDDWNFSWKLVHQAAEVFVTKWIKFVRHPLSNHGIYC